MCVGAITWAKISHVYYAADRNDADKIGFRDKCMFDNKCNIRHMKHVENTIAPDIMEKWHKLKSRKNIKYFGVFFVRIFAFCFLFAIM